MCGSADSRERHRTFVVAICGASGSVYGLRLVKALLEAGARVFLIVSDAGRQVLGWETGYTGGSFPELLESRGLSAGAAARLEVLDANDYFTAPASGSFRHDGMVICPASMGTLAAIASGNGSNLIHRAADVSLKEKRKLILVPRETPLSTIHMENMLRAARAGATILPASPSFYGRPSTIEALVDTVVARILDHLDVPHDLVKPWGAACVPDGPDAFSC